MGCEHSEISWQFSVQCGLCEGVGACGEGGGKDSCEDVWWCGGVESTVGGNEARESVGISMRSERGERLTAWAGNGECAVVRGESSESASGAGVRVGLGGGS